MEQTLEVEMRLGGGKGEGGRERDETGSHKILKSHGVISISKQMLGISKSRCRNLVTTEIIRVGTAET